MVTTQERIAARAECRRLNAESLDLCANSEFLTALQVSKSSVELAIAKLSPEEEVIAECHDLLSWICLCLGLGSEAEKATFDARAIRGLRSWYRRGALPSSPLPLESVHFVAWNCQSLERYSQAAFLFTTVIKAAENAPDVDKEYLADNLIALGDCELHSGNPASAAALCDRALDILRTHGTRDEEINLLYLQFFDEIYTRAGRSSDAKHFSDLWCSYWEKMGR